MKFIRGWNAPNIIFNKCRKPTFNRKRNNYCLPMRTNTRDGGWTPWLFSLSSSICCWTRRPTSFTRYISYRRRKANNFYSALPCKHALTINQHCRGTFPSILCDTSWGIFLHFFALTLSTLQPAVTIDHNVSARNACNRDLPRKFQRFAESSHSCRFSASSFRFCPID